MANPDSQESKYWKLMSELKQKIVDGTYQAGDKMPSENELAAFYQVSRHKDYICIINKINQRLKYFYDLLLNSTEILPNSIKVLKW